MFGEGDLEGEEEPEDVLTRARRRRRMNEETNAAATTATTTATTEGNDGKAGDQSGRKPRSLQEIRKERIAKEPDETE